MTFSEDMVHILPGYPMQSPDDPDVALVAFYLSLPHGLSNSAMVNKDVLKDIVKSEMAAIGGSIGGTIVSVDPLPSTKKQLENKNESDRNDDKSKPNLIIIFASVGGVLLFVVIAALLLGCKRRDWYFGH